MSFFCLSLISLLCGIGCHRSAEKILGQAPKGETRTVLAVRAGDTAPQVTLTGVMTEKCPVAGCWFKLRDGTGCITVDTKSAGFAVVNVPLETKLTVSGKIVAEGDQVAIEATGLRY